jgi:5'-nucleotidase (lipoprotein e(P4) family)
MTHRHLRLLGISVCLAILLSACATVPGDRAPTPNSHAFDGLHWFRNSAEKSAIYEQTYRAAFTAAQLRSAGLEERSWAVVLDVDETILDNSEYERRLVDSGREYDNESWNAWVLEEAATVLPGAKEFTDRVRAELKGRIVLVTNREQSQCPATEANLRRVGVAFDLILCDRDGTGDKNPRFEAVAEGTEGLPPLNVVLWVGDNIKDFPSLTQNSPGDLSAFGTRYFLLPNPMYGSWQSVP